MRSHLIALIAFAVPAVALAAAPPASAREVEAATTALSRSLHDALRRNGSLESAKAAYDASPVDGGEVVAFQWMLADCLRVQRSAFRTLLADADRLPALAEGFDRRRAVLHLLERMVEFRRANRRLASLSRGALPASDLPPLMRTLERQLAEMDTRVADLKPLVEAAL